MVLKIRITFYSILFILFYRNSNSNSNSHIDQLGSELLYFRCFDREAYLKTKWAKDVT